MTSLKTLMSISLCALPTLALAHDSPHPAKPNWTQTDTAHVLNELHATNTTEIAAGKLARNNSASDEIKSYGDRLVADHERADTSVSNLAATEHIILSDKASLDSETGAMLERLRKLQGAEFDRQFLDMMVTDHDNAIAMVKAWQSDTADKPLRALLSELLPTLKKHSDDARRLAHRKPAALTAEL